MGIDRIINGNGVPVGPPPMAIAAPMNDTQMVCLMASMMNMGNLTPSEAVGRAREIMVEAIVQMKGGRAIGEAVQKRVNPDG